MMKFRLLSGAFLACSASAFQVQHQPNVFSSPSSSLFRRSCMPLAATLVNTEEHAERDIQGMTEWAFDLCGVQPCPGFQLTTEDGEDYSLMTTEPIEQGSVVVAVPAQMVLSSSQAKQELEAMGNIQESTGYLGRLGQFSQLPQFYLFLKLLVEYERGQGSPYFPWINSLPRRFYNAASMTDFCYECLPPLVFSLARTERVKFDNFYYALQKASIISEETKEDKELARWAFNVVYTRCWGSEEEKQIIPMADMFNHGTETEVELTVDEQGNGLAYATRDIEAGSPLRMSYGCPTNPSALFATYGFLDESSPATFCKIMTIKPNKELEDLGLDFSRMLFYRDTGDVSQEVWDVLLYQVLSNNRDVQKQFYDAHMTGDEETKNAIHQHYFLETTTALKDHVDTFLSQLDGLSNKAIGKDMNEHPRLPLILAHNEFVKQTFLNVKARLDPMVEAAAGAVYS